MSVVQAVDPRTGAVTAGYRAACVDDLDGVMAAALRAAEADEMRDDGLRACALRLVAQGLRARADDVVEVATEETGLPDARLRGELERTAVQLEHLGQHVAAGEHHDAIIDLADTSARPVPRPDLRRTRVPLGPVAVFGASNFPLAFSTAGGDTASALAAGCPVIVKGHPSHPGTGILVADIVTAALAEGGLPEAAFSHLLAADLDVAAALVEHPATAAVAFTGSFRGGASILARANARATPIPVFAEMGSLNPVVITSAAYEARAAVIVETLAAAIGTFGGQLCTKPGIVFAPAGTSLADDLARALAGRDREVLLNANVHGGYREGTSALAATPGVTRLTPEDGEGPGFSATASVFSARAEAVATTPALREEYFGPAAIVLEYRGDDDLHTALESFGGQLAVSVYAEPDDRAALAPLVRRLAQLAGRVIFDGVPTGVSVTLAMQHGGPWPASSAPGFTSVGARAVDRFLRPVAFQETPDELLPPAVQDRNPLAILRIVNGRRTRDAVVRPA
jgi:NADP-dependent aldehyde dehydrogenase